MFKEVGDSWRDFAEIYGRHAKSTSDAGDIILSWEALGEMLLSAMRKSPGVNMERVLALREFYTFRTPHAKEVVLRWFEQGRFKGLPSAELQS